DKSSTPAPEFELHRYDDTNAEVSVTTWTDDNAGSCPIHGSASLIDTQDRILLLYATGPLDSSEPMLGLPAHHLAARWVDAKTGPLTDWFDAGQLSNGTSFAGQPLIGGGAAVRVGGDWVASIPSGTAEARPAPAFCEAKKDAQTLL